MKEGFVKLVGDYVIKLFVGLLAAIKIGFNPSEPIPNAIFAAQPPRRTDSPSTRKDNETFSSEPATSESVNLPEKVIKWSRPTEPATPIFI